MTDILGPASALNAVGARPSDGRQYGAADTFFKDCSSPSTQDGTQVSAAWLNQVTGVLRALARANGLKQDGITPVVAYDQSDNMPLNGVSQLVQRGQLNFATDKGTSDQMLATPATAVAEYLAGMRFLVLKNPAVGANATTTPTINFGLGNLTVVKDDGSALGIADLRKGGLFEVVLDGAGNARLNALLAPSDVRVNLPAAITIFVRPDGSDASNGSTNTSAAMGGANSAFQTLGAAYAYLTKAFNPGFSAAIQLGGPGSYPGFVATNNGVTGNISILGDQTPGQANQGNYVITPVAFSNGYVCVLSTIQTITLDGVTLDASSLTNAQTVQVARAGGQGTLALGRVTLRYSGSNANVSMIVADTGSTLNFTNNLTVSVGTVGAIISGGGNVAVTLPAGVTMNIANATFNNFASVFGGQTTLQLMSFSGSGNTGSRYTVTNEGVLIPPGGANIAAIPGSTAGIVAIGGGYVPGDLGQPWTVYSAGITSTSGAAFGSAASTIRYQRWGKWVVWYCQINIATVGSASGGIVTQLPITPVYFSAFGVETAVNGKGVSARSQNSSGQIVIFNSADNSSPIVAGTTFILGGIYEAVS